MLHFGSGEEGNYTLRSDDLDHSGGVSEPLIARASPHTISLILNSLATTEYWGRYPNILHMLIDCKRKQTDSLLQVCVSRYLPQQVSYKVSNLIPRIVLWVSASCDIKI